ncbi:unnamed protein product [Effrenium voratum]|nr:unnamed protein product [Effrenium voratum]
MWSCCLLFGVLVIFGAVVKITTAGDVDQPIFAALDTGTSLIAIPAGDFEPVAVAMFGSDFFENCGVSNGNLICSCDVAQRAKALTIVFGDKSIVLNAADMFEKVGVSEQVPICMSGLASTPGGVPFWILGDAFLRQVYAVHSFTSRKVALFPYRPEVSASEAAASDLFPCPVALSLALEFLGLSLAWLAFAPRRSLEFGEPLVSAPYEQLRL